MAQNLNMSLWGQSGLLINTNYCEITSEGGQTYGSQNSIPRLCNWERSLSRHPNPPAQRRRPKSTRRPRATNCFVKKTDSRSAFTASWHHLHAWHLCWGFAWMTALCCEKCDFMFAHYSVPSLTGWEGGKGVGPDGEGDQFYLCCYSYGWWGFNDSTTRRSLLSLFFCNYARCDVRFVTSHGCLKLHLWWWSASAICHLLSAKQDLP